MLDLANITTSDSPQTTTYLQTWQDITGEPLDDNEIRLGVRWAALQIPAQYLPWTVSHATTPELIAVLDRIDRSLSTLIRP